MKKIPLTQGKFAIVNDIDYAFLMQWKWFFSTGDGYAKRGGRKADGLIKHKNISMHRVILGRKLGHSDFLDTDHKNRTRLDSRRGNLRSATHSQNIGNSSIRPGSSKFKGVHWFKRDKNWQVRIQVEGNRKHLGLFTDETEAAKAYNKAALEHFGKFACLNPV